MNTKGLLGFINLEHIIASLPGHVYWKDAQGVYLGCNNKQANSLGFQYGHEVVGKTDFDLLKDRKKILTLQKNDKRIMVSGMPETIEEVVQINGEDKIVLSNKTPLKDEQGNSVGILGISLDITELKNNEAYLKKQIEQNQITLEHIIASLPGHVYWKDTQGVYFGCNDSQASSLGLRYGSQVIGKTDFDLPWGKDVAISFQKNDKRIMETGIAETIEEKTQINGKEGVVLSSKTPLKDRNGKCIGILGISLDISARKKAEQDLILAKEIAEAANQSKTEFLRNMRHDLRTPFSGILGLAEVLAAEESNFDKKESLSCIAESAQALLNHINEILDCIEAESGKFPILEKEFDLHLLLQDVIHLLLPSAKNKQLNFTMEVDLSVPRTVVGDAVRTHRILMNLLSNAIKFTQQGDVKLKVWCEYESTYQLKIYFVVEDTGIGIPEDKQDIVFERFNRVTSSYSGVYPGKGLGLRMVRQFLDEINGQVKLNSVVNQGTQFIVVIPYANSLFASDGKTDHQPVKAKVMTESIPTIAKVMSFPEVKNTKIDKKTIMAATQHKILLVEDNAIAARVAHGILKRLNCSVDIANDGRTALDCIETTSYDLVFMDIGLPDMNGCELTRQIRANPLTRIAQIPIIAVTGHNDSETQQHCLDAKINTVLSKPLTKSQAEAVLNAFIPERNQPEKVALDTLQGKDTGKDPVVDFNYAKQLLNGNEAILNEMLDELAESLPSEIEALTQAFEEKNWENLRAITHKLKGGSSYCGTLRLNSACKELESDIKSGLTERMPLLYANLLSEIKAVQTFIQGRHV